MNRVNNLSSLFVFINCIIFLSYKSSILDYWLGTNSLHCQLRKCSIWFDLQIQCSYSYIDIYTYSIWKQTIIWYWRPYFRCYQCVCVFVCVCIYSSKSLLKMISIKFVLYTSLFSTMTTPSIGVVSIIKSAYLSLSLCLFSLCFAALTSVIQG